MTENNNEIPHNLPIDNTEGDSHVSFDDHDHNDDSSKETSGSDNAIKYALIAGFLVILFTVSVGIVSFLPSIISSVSNTASAYLFSNFSTQSKLTLTLDKNEISTGQPFVISWKNNTADKNISGSYSLNYKCIEGITLTEFSSGKTIVCGTYFPIGNSDGSIKLNSNSKNTSKIQLPINISFFETGSKEPKLTNSISILDNGVNTSQNNDQATAKSNLTVNQNNSNASNNSANDYYPANGKSDLSISLVKRGIVLNDGSYRETSVIDSGSKVMIQFQITNNGTVPSGDWSLTATLPTTIQNERTFSSGTEPSIKPGASYTMSLAFDSYDTSINQAILTLLSSSDSNLSNNNLTVPFTAGSGYNTTYNNYNNNNNYYSGNANLNISIINIGQFNRSNQQFYNYGNNIIYSGSTVGIQFQVTNNSSVASGLWLFRANVPTYSNGNYNYYNSGTYNYDSGTEPSLAPGQSANFTIAFDNPNIGSDTIYINTYGNNISNVNGSASKTFYVTN